MNEVLLSMWRKGRHNMVVLLEKLKPEDLNKRFTPESAGIGFLLFHNAEVELLFCNLFFDRNIGHSTKTIGGVQDTGQCLDLIALKTIIQQTEHEVSTAIMSLTPERWTENVEFFLGQHTRAEGLARLINHTGYHTGQTALIYIESTEMGFIKKLLTLWVIRIKYRASGEHPSRL